MRYLGIDPGLSGAWVLLESDGALVASDLVPQRAGRTGKSGVDLAALAQAIAQATKGGNVIACLEQVGAMPGQGGTSMFTFGRTVGAWEGIVACMALRLVMVRPAAWSRLVSSAPIKDKAARKAASASAAAAQWPTLPLARKKDWARADAAWIAEYARQEDVRVGRCAQSSEAVVSPA